MASPSARRGRVSSFLGAVQGPIAERAAGASIILFCATVWAALLLVQGARLFLLEEAGFGDNYVAYDVQQYIRTGVIYRDLSQPPYMPSSYGPLVYVSYSIPGRIRAWQNPLLGLRLISIAFFLLCIAMVVSIVRKLQPKSHAWAWALLLAGSIACMQDWVLQIRGDFPAIFFALAAIRLLLMETPSAVLAAGLCAGCVTNFKFTMVAALAAGIVWFFARRNWKDLAIFASAGILASVGAYLLWSVREPRMIAQIASMRLGVVDIKGFIRMTETALSEPVVLLALAAIPIAPWKLSSRPGLLLLFAVFSWLIAGVTEFHPGSNINYFYEGLFALVPAAVVGVQQIRAMARTHGGLAALIAALFVVIFTFPAMDTLYRAYPGHEGGPRVVAAHNASYRQLEDTLRGSHIFSTVERLALIDPQPALVNPFGFWRIDPRPMYKRIGNSEFDVVITDSPPISWRGIDWIPSDLRKAIVSAYTPACLIRGSLFHLPRNRPATKDLLQKLYGIGCTPAGAPVYPAW